MTASGLVVYVIVRVESVSSGSPSVTVRGVLRTAEDAEAEVRRLNRSAPSGTTYLWQPTTYLARPAGERKNPIRPFRFDDGAGYRTSREPIFSSV